MFRYRRMSDNLRNPQAVGGDMVFGRGSVSFTPHNHDFLLDSPTAVAQAVLTRLLLFQGEWFLNRAEGTPWFQNILGQRYRTGLPDSIIRGRILSTPYVTYIEEYASSFNPASRVFAVSARIFTAFGLVTQAPVGAMMSPSGTLIIPLQTSLTEAPSQIETQHRPQPLPALPVQARALPPR